ncbi:MAG TPA: Nif3-like dinuclear metal center hexameric protein [Chitinophagaceae bacterium]|nr:Nif3-like dinuclear metal center hexameric protein [Chitinophagaceae bacterium]
MDHFKTDLNRRKFIESSLKTAGAAALLTIPPADLFAAKKEYTVQEIIDIILKDIPGAPFKETVDTLKSGNGDSKVTGIVTTMFATVDVIKKAAAQKANFIIAHEPTFYNHADDVSWTGENDVVKQKQELLRQSNITVWRFHDQWHAHKPDGIMYGVLKRTGWLRYNKEAEHIFNIPVSSLKSITGHLKTSLGIEHVRMIGDLDASCEKIALLPGASGGQRQISIVEKERPDLVIVGELHEWETAEYIRDGKSSGSKTSMIILGHGVSEEPGMDWLAEWLRPKIEGININHIPSGNPFKFV